VEGVPRKFGECYENLGLEGVRQRSQGLLCRNGNGEKAQGNSGARGGGTRSGEGMRGGERQR
jgi:hypothetical protein